MILSTLERAILDRIKADTGSGGLYESSAWSASLLAGGAWANIGAPPTGSAPSFPNLVYTINADEEQGFVGDDFAFDVTFEVFDQIGNGASRVSGAVDRLFGNAMLQAGRVPTYGFNRHLLVLSSNFLSAVGSHCLVTSMGVSMVDEHIIKGSLTMRTHVSALASNP